MYKEDLALNNLRRLICHNIEDQTKLSGATTPSQSGPGSDGNEGVLHISQSSSITGTSLLDCLVSYPGHSFGGSYPSAKK